MLVLGGVALFGAITLVNRWQSDAQPAVVAPPLQTVHSCDLNRGECSVTLASGQHARFSIAPMPVPLMQPLTLRLQAPGLPPTTRVSVDFDGVDMHMGFNRTTLRADGMGDFAGSTVLPVCATGAMRWQASVAVEGEPAPIRFVFSVAAQR